MSKENRSIPSSSGEFPSRARFFDPLPSGLYMRLAGNSDRLINKDTRIGVLMVY